MYCPHCGQEQTNEQIRFCSRCGFLLAGVAELMANEGILPVLTATADKSVSTPRKRGLRQGLFIFLLTFLVVPIVAILTLMVRAEEPFFVAIAAILFFMGGLLRMAYALMFESNNPQEQTFEQSVYQSAQSLLSKKPEAAALPPQQSIPVSSYEPPLQGKWRDTNELTPKSVTENTTKLLQKDE